MTEAPKPNAAGDTSVYVRHALLARLLEDEAGDGLQSLEAYQQAFPGHDELVANVVAELGNDRTATFDGSERIGPYVLIEEIGRGGQGTVFLARDTRLPRLVALKLLSNVGDRLGAVRIERFRREAQAASRLDHAGICAVYETGEIDDVLFLAMRYVPGESLAMHVARALSTTDGETSRLSLPQTESPASATRPGRRRDFEGVLLLLERVARALHVAHEAGIVHRDVKPGNIMVTPEGEPVVLDFGLARDLEDSAPDLTRTEEVFGTPAYMSLEQLRPGRHRIDRRTDVYALGVTLYECLTLRRPFAMRGPVELAEAIERGPAPDPRWVVASLPADLAIVVTTALAARPEHRYQSAVDLAEDLRAVRQLEPIRARPAGRMLRLWRWIQRNPGLAASQILVFLSLSAGLVVSLIAYDEAARERSIAEAEAQHRGDIGGFLRWVLSSPSPYVMGPDAPLSQVLERAMERVDEMFLDRPRTRADMLRILGTMHRSLGRLSEGADLLERSVSLWREIDPDGVEYATALNELVGGSDTGGVDAQQQLDWANESLAILRRELGRTDRRTVNAAYNAVASLINLNRTDECWRLIEEFEPAMQGATELARRDWLEARARTYMHEGRWSGAAADFRAILALPDDPDDPAAGTRRHMNVDKFTLAAFRAGEPLEALEAQTESLNYLRSLLGEDHPRIAVALSNRSIMLRMLGRHKDAVEPMEQALAVSRRALEPPHEALAINLNNLGALYQHVGRSEEALELLEEGLAMSEEIHGKHHKTVASACSAIADVHANLGQFDDAVEWMGRNLGVLRELYGDEHFETLCSFFRTARRCIQAGDLAAAKRHWEHALPLTEKLDASMRVRALHFANISALALTHGDGEQAAEGVPLLRQTLAVVDAIAEDRPDWRGRVRGDLAEGLHVAGESDEARTLFTEARDLMATATKAKGEDVQRLKRRIAVFEKETGTPLPAAGGR